MMEYIQLFASMARGDAIIGPSRLRLGYRVPSRARFKAADLAAAKLDLLNIYFGNDVTGGNL